MRFTVRNLDCSLSVLVPITVKKVALVILELCNQVV